MAGGRDHDDRADDVRGHHGGRARDRGYDRGSGRPSGPSLHFTRLRRITQDSWATFVMMQRSAERATPGCALRNRNSKSAQAGMPVLPVGSLTRPRREFIDAFPRGCQHRTSFAFR